MARVERKETSGQQPRVMSIEVLYRPHLLFNMLLLYYRIFYYCYYKWYKRIFDELLEKRDILNYTNEYILSQSETHQCYRIDTNLIVYN